MKCDINWPKAIYNCKAPVLPFCTIGPISVFNLFYSFAFLVCILAGSLLSKRIVLYEYLMKIMNEYLFNTWCSDFFYFLLVTLRAPYLRIAKRAAVKWHTYIMNWFRWGKNLSQSSPIFLRHIPGGNWKWNSRRIAGWDLKRWPLLHKIILVTTTLQVHVPMNVFEKSNIQLLARFISIHMAELMMLAAATKTVIMMIMLTMIYPEHVFSI